MTTSLAAAQLQRLPLEDIGATCLFSAGAFDTRLPSEGHDDVLVGFKKVFNIVAASSCKVGLFGD